MRRLPFLLIATALLLGLLAASILFQSTTSARPASPPAHQDTTARHGASSAPILPNNTPISPVQGVATPTATSCTIAFTDVNPAYPFYVFIRCLACRGIAEGYCDDTFRPQNPMNRASLAQWIAGAAGYTEVFTTATFADVPTSSYYYLFVERVNFHQVLSGYPCGGPGEPCDPQNRPYFRLYETVLRGPLARTVADAAGFTDPVPSTQQSYTDVPNNNPFWLWIERLTGRGLISGYACGGPGEPCDPQNRTYFRPGNGLVRGQVSKIIANTFFPNCSTPLDRPVAPVALLCEPEPPPATPVPSATLVPSATPPPTFTLTATPRCTNGAWATVAPYLVPIAAPAAVGLGQYLYSFGGDYQPQPTATPPADGPHSPSGRSPAVATDGAARYNPATNAWTVLTQLPGHRFGSSAVTDGQYIYILNGTTDTGPQATLWRYDPNTNTYTTLAAPSLATYGQAAVYLDGKIYRITGCSSPTNSQCIPTASSEVYTLATNSWTSVAAYPFATQWLAASTWNGYIYTVGGGDPLGGRTSPKAYRYNPATDYWDDDGVPDIPYPTGLAGVGQAWLGGRWVFGGGNLAGATGYYDPADGSWIGGSPLSAEKHYYPGWGVVGGAIYLIGGLTCPDPWGNLVWSPTVERYTEPPCATLTPSVTPPPPSSTRTPTSTRTATSTPSNTPIPSPVPPSATATPRCALGAWATVAPYPSPVAAPAAVSLGQYLYSFGGDYEPPATPTALADGLRGPLSAYPAAATNDSARYNPTTNAWTSLAPLPAARVAAAAVTDGTAIYILNGTTDTTPQANLWRYNPTTNTYTTLPAPISGTYGHGAAYLNGKIYRIAGITQFQNGRVYTNTVEVFDLASNSWSNAAPYPLALGFPSVTVWNGGIYVAGGMNDGLTAATPKTYRYDPATNTWDDDAIADLPNGGFFGLGGEWLGGHWVLGGSFTAIWDPATNSWYGGPPPLQELHQYPGAGVVNGALYIVGGLKVVNPPYYYAYSSTVERYTEPPCATLTPTATPPSGTATRTSSPQPTTPTPTTTPCGIIFSDVPPTSPFYAYIRCLACRGVISGYADGSYRPNATITRGQTCKIAGNAAAWTDPIPSAQQTFSDVPPTHPFWAFIERAALHGVVSGYADGTFRPDAPVTRSQFAKISTLAVGWSDPIPSAQQTFEDVPPGGPFWSFIERAASHGVISGYTCGGPGEPCLPPPNRPYYRPYASITRAQAAKVVANTFFPNCVTP